MLYVGNTSLTYVFSAYKQNLLIADQKRYITTIYHGILFLLTNVFQILILNENGEASKMRNAYRSNTTSDSTAGDVTGH